MKRAAWRIAGFALLGLAAFAEPSPHTTAQHVGTAVVAFVAGFGYTRTFDHYWPKVRK